jgi:hypothetical protein
MRAKEIVTLGTKKAAIKTQSITDKVIRVNLTSHRLPSIDNLTNSLQLTFSLK